MLPLALHPRPPTRGRRNLLERLDELLAGARRGEGAVAFLEGPPGSGRAHLARESLHRAAPLPCLCAWGEPGLRRVPLAAWRPAALQLLGLARSSRRRSPRTAVEESLARLGLPDLPPHQLEPLLHLGLAPHPGTRAGSPPARDTQHAELVRLLRRAFPEGRGILLLLDADWLDTASWDLAWKLRLELPGLVILATRTGRELPPHRPGRQSLLHLPLSPLPTDDLRAILEDRGLLPADAELAEALLAEARGSPLDAILLARALRASGEGTRRLGELRRLGPAAALFRTLPPSPRFILQAASVLGQHFDEELLGSLALQDAGELSASLEALGEEGWLQPTDQEEPRGWRFAHLELWRAVYLSNEAAQRRELHRRAAELLEARSWPPPDPAVLARHRAEAEDPEGAARAFALAGTAALAAGAAEEALQLYERARALEQESAPSLQYRRRRSGLWELEMGRARMELGQVEQARAQFENALALFGDAPPRSEDQRRLRAGLRLLGYLARSFLPSLLFRAPPIQRERLRERAEAWACLAEASFYEHPSLSLLSALEALRLADMLGDAGLRVGPGLLLSLFATALGWSGLSRLALERAGRDAASSGEAEKLKLLLGRSALALRSGHWEEAQEAARAFLRSGHWKPAYAEGLGHILLALLHHRRGELETARSHYLELQRSARNRGNRQQLAWGLSGAALCRFWKWEERAAEDELRQALAFCRDPVIRAGLLAALATLLLRRGEAGPAELAAESARQLLVIPRWATLSTPLEALFLLIDYDCSLLEASREHPEAARAASRDARRLLEPLGRLGRSLRADLRYRYAAACLDWLEGSQEAALASWRQVAEEARALGLAMDEGLALYRLSLALPDDEALARQALEALERPPLRWHAQRLRRLRAQGLPDPVAGGTSRPPAPTGGARPGPRPAPAGSRRGCAGE